MWNADQDGEILIMSGCFFAMVIVVALIVVIGWRGVLSIPLGVVWFPPFYCAYSGIIRRIQLGRLVSRWVEFWLGI